MILLDGKKLRDLTVDSLKDEIAEAMVESGILAPQLVILQVGNIAESNSYIAQKKIFAEKVGIKVLHKIHPEKISEKDLIAEIEKLNKNEKVHGIIVQLPIPASLNEQKIIDTIDPKKDVDGMTKTNVERLCANDEQTIVPPVALGVISLLEHYDISIEGKKVVVVGHSAFVGKPIALAFINEGATVTVCHRGTEDLKKETRQAEILVVAAGSPGLITKDYVKEGQAIVDVGINFVEKNGKKHMVGDVDFEAVKNIVSAISPVPGGVGPMTVASLFSNLLQAWKAQW